MNLFEAAAKLTMDTSGFVKAIKAVQDTKSDISNFFQKIGNATDTAKNGISVFGDVLKANLVSEAITKGFETIVSGFKSMGDAAKGFIEDSIQVGMSFDSSMAQVAATMGMTVADMESQVATVGDFTGNLREFAEKMGAETAFSAVQAADALNYMALAGYDVEKSMNMLPNVLNLAAAGGMDLANASDMITDAASALGLTTEQTTEMVDKMAMASSKSNTSVSQLGSAILTVGGTAKMLQGGTTELATVLGILADNGIKGSESGTALRNMLLSLSAPTNEAKKQLDELGVSVFDSSGNIRNLNDIFLDFNSAFSTMTQQQRTEAISNIFNKRDLKSVEALLANVGDRYAELSGYIDDAAGAGEQMAKTQLDNLKGDVTILQSAFEGLKIAISNKVTPALRKFAQFGGDALSKLTTAFKKNGLNAVSVVLPGIIEDGIKLITKEAPKAVKTVIKVLKIIGKAIAQNSDLIAESVNDITADISDYFLRNLPQFIQNGQKILSGIANGISGNLAILIPATADAILTVIDELTKPESITDFIDSGIQLLTALAEGLGDSASILIERVPDIIENLKQGFSDNTDKIKGAGETILSAITDEFGEISFSDTVDSIVSGLANALDGEEWKSVTEKISTGIQNIDFSEITSNISKLIIGVTDSAGKIIDGIDWGVIGGAIGEALNGVDWYGILDSLFETVAVAIKEAPELLKGIAETIDSQTALQIATIGINLLTGKAIIGGIASYVSSTAAFTTVSTALSGLFTKLAPVVGAFIVGWDIGTKIRNEIDDIELFDESFNEVIDRARDNVAKLRAGIESLWTGDYERSYRDAISAMYETGKGFASKKYNDAYMSWIDDYNAEKIAEIQSLTVDFDDVLNELDTSLTDYIEYYKSSGAYLWGQDFSQNFADGISDNSGKVINALDEMNQEIEDNNGFSLPKKGILSKSDTWMPDMMQLFADGIRDNIPLVIEKITSLGEKIKSTIKSPIDSAVSWGGDMIDNFISGINQKWNDAVNTVANFAGMIASYIGFSEPEKGALSRFHTFAPDMMELFAQGIRDNQNLVMSQAETLAGNLADTFQNPLAIGTEFTGFDSPEIPDMSYEVRFIDNLDNIIEKVKSLADKAVSISAETELIQVHRIISPEYSLPELSDLSLTVDTSIIDKIRDMLANPLEISVRFADGLENIKSMFNAETLETPSRAMTSPYNSDYIRQIEGIRNSYSTTNNYYNTANNSYETSRNYSSDSTRKQTVIQNLTLSVPGFNINSPDDISELVSVAIREISEQLEVLHVQDNRGFGGVGF